MNVALIAVLVAVRVAATSWANVVQKRMLHAERFSPLGMFAIEWGWMALLTVPWWMTAYTLSGAFWFWMLLTCALEVPGNVMLLRSLRSTELSIFGPLASFKPAISLLLGLVLFAEMPTLWGVLGVLIVLIGSVILTSEPRDINSSQLTQAQRRSGIRDRLLSTVMTATASVFLKQALDCAEPWQALAVWSVLGWALGMVWLVLDRRRPGFARQHIQKDSPTRRDWQATGLVAVALLIMQGCTIAIFARMNVGYALALFQIGSLVSVLLGHRLFGEANLMRRLLAALIMVAGAVVIIVLG